MRTLVSFIALLAGVFCYAQAESNSLAKAIRTYQETLGATFSFDAELIELANSERSFSTSDLDLFIQEIETNYPVKVEKIDEDYYTITAIETSFHLSVSDSLEGTALGEEYAVQVIVNDAPILTTYENGTWNFSYKPFPKDDIRVFSLGFETREIAVSDLFNQKSLSVSLGLPTRRLNTVVVEDYLTKGINLLPSNQSIRIDVNDLPLLPGETDGDIFASVSALPGVSSPDGRAGNLLIRGSETDQTLILFDNIPVYHRGHYYGTISPYNPKIVSDVEVYRSGFHPRLGDRVGGAIVINSDEAGEESNYGVGANTLFGMGYGKVRISDKLSSSFSFRNSYPRSFQSPKLEEISQSVFAATSLVDGRGRLTQKVDVTFRDYNGRLDFDVNKRNQLSLSGILTTSKVNFIPIGGPDAATRSNDNNYTNNGINLSWKSDWYNGWKSVLKTTYSEYDFSFKVNQLDPGLEDLRSNNKIKDFNVIQEVSKVGLISNIQFGIDYKWQEVARDYQNELLDFTLYADQDVVSSKTIAPYANYEYFGFSRWYLQVGFRSTYYSELEDFSFAPRALINYDLTQKVTLKASHGWYNQYLSQVKNLEYSSGGFDNELWTLADKESGFIIRGAQSMVGGIVELNDWIFDIESFYKLADDITIYESVRLDPRSEFYTMDQETYGLDFLAKNQINEATDVWIGYSYHDSEIVIDTARDVSYESKFVQPHAFFLGGAFKKNRWKLSASWRYASGLSTRSIQYADLNFGPPLGPDGMPLPPRPGAPPPPPGAPPSQDDADLPDRFPAVHSLDVSASYKIPKTDARKWSASFGLSIINTLDQTNLTDRVLRGPDGLLDREAIGFAPNLMIIFEW